MWSERGSVTFVSGSLPVDGEGCQRCVVPGFINHCSELHLLHRSNPGTKLTKM